MLAAFAEAGIGLGRDDYTQAARKNAEFLYDNLRSTTTHRLKRTWKAGHEAKYNAYLEDYAFLADGLLALYQNTFETRWFDWAHELTDMMGTHFSDTQNGGFFDTSDDHEQLLQRPKDLQDNAIACGNSMAARVLILMGQLTGEGRYTDQAAQMTASLSHAMTQYPRGFGHWLGNAWLLAAGSREIAIVGDPTQADTQALLTIVRSEFRPNTVAAVGETGAIPLLAERTQIDNQPTAYVCRNFTCNLPVTTPAALRRQLITPA